MKNKYSSEKQLIIITGCAGAGKTTIGNILSKKLNYAYIDKDTVTKEFTDFILNESGSNNGDRESVFYKEKVLPIEYSVTFKLCKEIIDNGCNVILVIPFINQIKDYEKWEDISKISGIDNTYNVKFIWIKHNIIAEKIKIEKRNAERDKNKLSNWEEYSKQVEGICPAKEYNAFEIVNDKESDIDEAIKSILNWINK